MTRRLADVATYAKVSEATVSRVLNGKPGVSEATRQAVLTALDVLGYERPTQLRNQRARLAGLVLPELQNPIFPAFAEIVADALSRRGITPVLCTRTAAGVTEAAYVDMLLEQQVSGIIFFGGQYHEAGADHRHYHLLTDRRLPVVLINAAYEDLGFPRVSVDDAHAIEQAFAHLETLGHERIGMVLGPPDHVPSNRKLESYRAARGDGEALVEHTMFSMQGGVAAAKRLLARGVTAVVCASDILALGVIRQARRVGLGVPGDVSVVGFDDSALMMATDPPLTTVRQPIEAMGQAAVSQLLSQIGGTHVSSEELLFEPELVVRASTGPAVRAEAVPVTGQVLS
jgi:LacI family transcriptional regulator, repressor for deo operon, udp, cdd, tsx, nupC, and nupG